MQRVTGEDLKTEEQDDTNRVSIVLPVISSVLGALALSIAAYAAGFGWGAIAAIYVFGGQAIMIAMLCLMNVALWTEVRMKNGPSIVPGPSPTGRGAPLPQRAGELQPARR